MLKQDFTKLNENMIWMNGINRLICWMINWDYRSTVSVRTLSWTNLSIATLCFEAPSGRTHSSSHFADTGPSMYNSCSTYFFANGGKDLIMESEKTKSMGKTVELLNIGTDRAKHSNFNFLHTAQWCALASYVLNLRKRRSLTFRNHLIRFKHLILGWIKIL